MIRATIATVMMLTVFNAVPASAQSSLSPRPGRGFATIGFVEVTGDPADTFNTFYDSAQPVSRGHLLVNAAVFVAPRIGVGVETFPSHDTTVVSTTQSVITTEGLHEKTTLMVTGRGRAVARSHFAVDGVFGLGALRQTRTFISDFNDPGVTNTTTTSDNTSAALSFGADGLFAGRHVVLSPQMRWYHLQRLGNPTNPAYPFPSRVVDVPAWLFAFGVTAGVTW